MRPMYMAPQALHLHRPAPFSRQCATGAAVWHRPPPAAPRARRWGCVRAGEKDEPGAAVDEPSTSGRADLDAVAPVETVGDVAEVAQAATVVQPARRQDSAVLSEDDIRRLATQRRQQAKAQNVGFIEGIREEVQLIEWPKPRQAVADTVVVIAIVGSMAGFLFIVNSVLAEGFRVLYGLPISLNKSIAQQIWEAYVK